MKQGFDGITSVADGIEAELDEEKSRYVSF